MKAKTPNPVRIASAAQSPHQNQAVLSRRWIDSQTDMTHPLAGCLMPQNQAQACNHPSHGPLSLNRRRPTPAQAQPVITRQRRARANFACR